MATNLTRTLGTPSSQRIGTLSFWVKRCRVNDGVSSGSMKIVQYQGSPTYFSIYMDDRSAQANWSILRIHMDDTQSPQYVVGTKMRFRDCSAWYHVVVRIDTTQASSGDRIRVYVNSELQTLGGLSDEGNQPAQDYDIPGWASGQTTTIGDGSSMYISQMIFADGQSYAPSTFGSTNTNNIWVPNASPSVTYGNNGYRLDFEGTGGTADASGFGADTSGNANHFTSNNLGTNPSVTDTPDNNFCTWNNLANSSMTTLSVGNLIATGNTSSNNGNSDGTMAPSGGKWYWEVKYVTAASSSATNYPNVGAYAVNVSRQPRNGGGNAESGYFDNGCSYKPDGEKKTNNSASSYGTAWSAGDIIGVALDLENYAIYFSRNGSWQDSGDPTSGASKTGAATTFNTDDGEAFVPACASYNNSVLQTNFGNSPFALASGNADANGEGSFEYAPPTGYYALCTNNLALYGG